MQKEHVLQLIDEKLAQIEEAETKNLLNGNLNFGLHVHLYRQSPYMKDFEKKRKQLRAFIWVDTFIIAFMLVGINSDLFDKISQNPFKAIVGIIVLSVVSGLLFVYYPLRSLVATANSTQKEVKKLMLYDLRQKVEALEANEMAAQKTGVAAS
jgi:hypothetical protein